MTDAGPGGKRSLAARVFLEPEVGEIARDGRKSPADDSAGIAPGRLRSGWRVVVQILLVYLFFLAASALFRGIYELIPKSALSSSADVGNLLILLRTLLQAIGAVLSVYVARRFLDHRSMASLGLPWGRLARRDIEVGFLIGGAMMLSVAAQGWLFGWLHIAGYAWQANPSTGIVLAVIYFLLLFAFVAVREEILIRGYYLQNLAEGLGRVRAAILSALIFSLLHASNAGFNGMALIGLLLAGVFFAYAYFRGGQLWLPIGLHLGWNFFEGPVFGLPVSGLRTFSLILHTVDGAPAVTGGAFGPEAGLALVPTLALGAVLVYLFTTKRNPRTPPSLPPRAGEESGPHP